MSDATSISSLPAPVSDNQQQQVQQINQNNIKMEVQEQIATAQQTPAQPNVPLAPTDVDPNAMNKVLTGLQQAQMQGMTQLPSRDIPMQTHQMTQDKQIQPNYVPDNEKGDYIKDEDTYETLLQKKKEKLNEMFKDSNSHLEKINEIFTNRNKVEKTSLRRLKL